MKNEASANKKSIIKIIWVVSLLFLIIQILIEGFLGLKLLIFSIDANLIKLVLVLFLLLSPIFLFNYKRFKAIKVIYIVLAIIFAIYASFMYLFCFSADICFYSYSPYENSKRELVVEETSFLMGGSGYFYERKYIIFMKQIHGTISYESPPSFTRGEATIKWLDENTVQVDYINNSKSHHDTEIVKFD
ncbi:hypothetical protein [Clostridium sp.]|uniref:hypothetical protein n=1 Tax=Clostridium sp. TaxID=1506 RepID=UPI00263602D7|nr:hypothetical protein [Clostridium sp.]